MTMYLVRRVLWLGVVLFCVALITFGLMHAVPGGPWDREKTLAPAVMANLNRKYGLDKPVWRQFVDYLRNALRGDLGVSYTYQERPVSQIISNGFRVTASLGLLAVAFTLVVGLGLGILSAARPNSLLDYGGVFCTTLGASIPSFVLGVLAVIVFAVKLGWLPTGGWGLRLDWPPLDDWMAVQQAVLPTLTLGALPSAYLARVTRASMLEVLRQDYVRTAWAKGLAEQTVILRHVVRNALLPVLTLAGPIAVNLVTGSFIIETIFSIPGVGRLFVTAVFQRDYGLIMGTILFYAGIVAFANLLVDMLYVVVDPRIRYS